MITSKNLPSNYEPYKILDFCSNKIIGVNHILEIGGVLPLLIGVGKVPRVWLQGVSEPNQHAFTTIVADSKSIHPAAKVLIKGDVIVVSLKDVTILKVEAKNSQQAKVSKIDLRPLGLNVFGDQEKLNMGNMQFCNSIFSEVEVAFGFET